MSYLPVPVTDERAERLLTDYFAYRASTFPTAGGYVTKLPDPALFTPPAGVFVLAIDDETGAATGCGGIRRLPDDVLAGMPPAVTYEVKHLWLTDAARGAGGGRALLAELERRAVGFGAARSVLDTNASLVAANRLYASSGYASIPPYNDNSNATTWYLKELG